MAFASLGTLGATNDKIAGTSIAHTTITTSLVAGNLCVVAVAKDNASGSDAETNEVTSITDSVGGNTWTKAYEYCAAGGAANAGATGAVYFSVLTNALPTGSVITANFSDSRTASTITCWGWSVGAGSSVIKEGTPDKAVSAVNNTTSLTVGSLANAEHLAIRVCAREGTSVTNTQSGWTLITTSATSGGSGTDNSAVGGMWKIEAASASVTSAPTSGSGAPDNVVILVVFKETASHAATGALTGQIGLAAGSAAHIAIHGTSGVLAGQIGSVAGSSVHNIPHPATGDLVGQLGSIAGSATRFRAFASSGVLAGQIGSISGAAGHNALHDTAGILTGAIGSVSGSATRFRQFAAAGDIVGAGAELSGSAARFRAFAATGVLEGQGSRVSGAALIAWQGLNPAAPSWTPTSPTGGAWVPVEPTSGDWA